MEHPPNPPKAQVHLCSFCIDSTFFLQAVVECPQGCFAMVEEALLPQHLEICVITKQKSREKELQQEQGKLEVLFVFVTHLRCVFKTH